MSSILEHSEILHLLLSDIFENPWVLLKCHDFMKSAEPMQPALTKPLKIRLAFHCIGAHPKPLPVHCDQHKRTELKKFSLITRMLYCT